MLFVQTPYLVAILQTIVTYRPDKSCEDCKGTNWLTSSTTLCSLSCCACVSASLLLALPFSNRSLAASYGAMFVKHGPKRNNVNDLLNATFLPPSQRYLSFYSPFVGCWHSHGSTGGRMYEKCMRNVSLLWVWVFGTIVECREGAYSSRLEANHYLCHWAQRPVPCLNTSTNFGLVSMVSIFTLHISHFTHEVQLDSIVLLTSLTNVKLSIRKRDVTPSTSVPRVERVARYAIKKCRWVIWFSMLPSMICSHTTQTWNLSIHVVLRTRFSSKVSIPR